MSARGPEPRWWLTPAYPSTRRARKNTDASHQLRPGERMDEFRYHTIEWTPPHGHDKRLRRRKARSRLRVALTRLVRRALGQRSVIERIKEEDYE